MQHNEVPEVIIGGDGATIMTMEERIDVKSESDNANG